MSTLHDVSQQRNVMFWQSSMKNEANTIFSSQDNTSNKADGMLSQQESISHDSNRTTD